MTGKILIVDDNGLMGQMLRDFLESQGYEVLYVESAVEALSKIEAESFDLVITDYSMPEMNGLELTRFVTKIKASLPVVGMSMYHIRKAFIDAGASDFMLKPFELKKLGEVVANYLKAVG